MFEFCPWAIVMIAVGFVLWFGSRTDSFSKKVLEWLPAILLAYLIPALLSGFLNLDFNQDSIHFWSKKILIPLAIVSVMSSMSLGQLKAVGWKPILIFLSGSLWISLFPVIYLFFLQDTDLVSGLFMDREYWKGLPPIVGSWIGGSTSQLVLKEVVECPENVFLTILVLDNILVNIWTLLMFQSIKKSDGINRILKIKGSQPPSAISAQLASKTPFWICLVVFVAAVGMVDLVVSSFVGQVVALSVVGLLVGNSITSWNSKFSLRLGEIAILFVMAILGLKLRFDLISFDTRFIGFLLVWLVGHFVFMLLVSKLLRVNSAWVSIASMANVGGIATAPAVTAAYKKEWMPHAIVLAILSMATGTFWGLLTIFLIENWVILSI